MVCLENYLGFRFFTEECHSYLNTLFRHAPDEVKIIYKNDATKSKIKYSCHCTLASKIQSKNCLFFFKLGQRIIWNMQVSIGDDDND